MTDNINKISELKAEKEKLEKLGNEQIEEIKKSFNRVKSEGRYALINKILIPLGAAILAGYGLKKLVDALRSDDEEPGSQDAPPRYEGDPPIYHRSSTPEHKKNNGLFSNVDWPAMAVRIAPFILSVGKKMYEEGNLPFMNPRENSEKVNE